MALVGRAISEALTPEEIKIVNHLAQAGKATVTATMQLLGDTRWHTTSLKLDRLRRKGVLRYVSSNPRDRSGFYQIVPDLSGDADDSG